MSSTLYIKDRVCVGVNLITVTVGVLKAYIYNDFVFFSFRDGATRKGYGVLCNRSFRFVQKLDVFSDSVFELKVFLFIDAFVVEEDFYSWVKEG